MLETKLDFESSAWKRRVLSLTAPSNILFAAKGCTQKDKKCERRVQGCFHFKY
jgi:hypothetical protein